MCCKLCLRHLNELKFQIFVILPSTAATLTLSEHVNKTQNLFVSRVQILVLLNSYHLVALISVKVN